MLDYTRRKYKTFYRARRTRLDWLDVVDERFMSSHVRGLVFFRCFMIGIEVEFNGTVWLIWRQMTLTAPQKR